MSTMDVSGGKWVLTQNIAGAGTVTDTLSTQGKFVDKNIDIVTVTPAGALSKGTGSVGLAGSESSIFTESSTQPSSGLYVTVTGAGQVSVGTSGWINSGTSEISHTAQKYYTMRTAQFSLNAASTGNIKVKATRTGYIANGETAASIPDGALSAGAGSVSATDSESLLVEAQSEPASGMYITVTGSGSVGVGTAGYLFTNTPQKSSNTATKYYTLPAATFAASGGAVTAATSGFIEEGDTVVNIQTGALSAGAGSVSATDSKSIITLSGTQPSSGMYITVTGSGTVSVGTAGYLTAGTSETSNTATKYYTVPDATFAFDGSTRKITASTAGFIDANATAYTVAQGALTVAGGGLTAGAGSSSVSSDGCYNGSTYDTTDKIIFAPSQAAGYYKITASGSGTVNRAAITKQITTAGYLAKDNNPVSQSAATSLSSNTATTAYYIQKSTLSQSVVTPGPTSSTVTIGQGYYPSDRTVTVSAMTTVTPSANFIADTITTYFNSGTSSSKDLTITPNYTTSAGYVAAASGAATSTNTKYYKIKEQTITETTTTVSGTTATRGTRTESVGWNKTAETISIASFANEATSGRTYVDISATTAAPVLVSGDYLYINKGWTDDLKISLAKLVPDGTDVKGHGEYILSGHSAYDDDGTFVAGAIQTYDGSYTVA